MVWVDEVASAAVDVDLRPKVLHRHRGAFDAPSGPPGAPRAVPARVAGINHLPEEEVQVAALLFRALRFPVFELAERLVREPIEPAIPLERVGFEKDVALDFVGV